MERKGLTYYSRHLIAGWDRSIYYFRLNLTKKGRKIALKLQEDVYRFIEDFRSIDHVKPTIWGFNKQKTDPDLKNRTV